MSRFIVVNPELNCIQGDIACDSAAGAVRRMEGMLSLETLNATWDVYRAPAGFPPAESPYDGLDAALVSMLASTGRPASVGNARRAPVALSA
jgi:hypothetical protein